MDVPFAKLYPRILESGVKGRNQRSTKKPLVLLEKLSEATTLLAKVPYRNYLDYEMEVSIVLHRSEPELFGYVLHNDFTDRSIEVSQYNRKDPAGTLSTAKNFAGSNAFSPVMRIGDKNLWRSIKSALWVNRNQRQYMDYSQHPLSPQALHAMVFGNPTIHRGYEWVVIGTGSPEGSIYQSPSMFKSLGLSIASGFNQKHKYNNWLNRFQLLASGDILTMHSSLFGTFLTRVQ